MRAAAPHLGLFDDRRFEQLRQLPFGGISGGFLLFHLHLRTVDVWLCHKRRHASNPTINERMTTATCAGGHGTLRPLDSTAFLTVAMYFWTTLLFFLSAAGKGGSNEGDGGQETTGQRCHRTHSSSRTTCPPRPCPSSSLRTCRTGTEKNIHKHRHTNTGTDTQRHVS